MGTLNAVYVRVGSAAAADAIRARYPTAYTEPSTEFYAIDQPDDRFTCPESELQALSSSLETDVIWLSFQSVVDGFAFHHWYRGKSVRSLVYGCRIERTWERVEGAPEAWEPVGLFRRRHMEIALDYLDNDAERSELQRIYREYLITPGNIEPSLDSRESARAVAEFFRLPGWSLTAGDS